MSVFLVMVSFVSAATCDVGEVKVVLRNNLFLHFTEPQASPLTLDEVRDLLIFYLGVDEEALIVDCTANGDSSNKPIASIVNAGGKAINIIPRCLDGTLFGECSASQPQYCYAGDLVANCDFCGCGGGSNCTTSQCIFVDSDITCFTDLDCGESYFTDNYYCVDDFVTKEYINYTCLSAGTTNSSCLVTNTTVELDFCDSSLNQFCVDGNSQCLDNLTCINNWQCTAWNSCSDGTQTRSCTDSNSCVTVTSKPSESQVCTGSTVTRVIPITLNRERQEYPDIYEDKIVWSDKRNGNWDIYMYDFSTGQEKRITTDLSNQMRPSISGDKIVWLDQRTPTPSEYPFYGDGDVFMYDIPTGKETQITTLHRATQYDPPKIDGKSCGLTSDT